VHREKSDGRIQVHRKFTRLFLRGQPFVVVSETIVDVIERLTCRQKIERKQELNIGSRNNRNKTQYK